MIPAIQRGCSAARSSLFAAPIVRTISCAPFVPPGQMPAWSRRATFIPSNMHPPISIGGKWGTCPKRPFGNEEDVGVRFHKEEIVKSKEITVQGVKGADWKAKTELLIDLRKGNYHVIEFPKGALEGEAGWVDDMMRMLSQGKKLNFYARFESGSGEAVHKNPDEAKMKELAAHAGGRDLVIHSLDVSKETGRKAAAQFLAALSAKSAIRMTFY